MVPGVARRLLFPVVHRAFFYLKQCLPRGCTLFRPGRSAPQPANISLFPLQSALICRAHLRVFFQAVESIAKPDFGARMTVRLAVAGAFHTSFMEPAVSSLQVRAFPFVFANAPTGFCCPSFFVSFHVFISLAVAFAADLTPLMSQNRPLSGLSTLFHLPPRPHHVF